MVMRKLSQDNLCSLILLFLRRSRLRTVKFIPPKCRLGFSRVLKEALDNVSSTIKRQHQKEGILNATRSWSLLGGGLQVMRETLAESSHPLSSVDEEDLDLGEQNIKQCKRKICDGHYTATVRVLSSSGVAPYNDATLEDKDYASFQACSLYATYTY
ncbi:hypothetical protein Tco_1551759 [Tanacetum coccineum]